MMQYSNLQGLFKYTKESKINLMVFEYTHFIEVYRRYALRYQWYNRLSTVSTNNWTKDLFNR